MRIHETWYIVLNPSAGNGKAGKKLELLQRELDQRSIPYEVVITASRRHAIELVATAMRSGFRQFISIGGDGTHHEVVNGLLQDRSSEGPPPLLAIINAGTGNDWARMHHIPNEVVKGVELIMKGKNILHSAGKISCMRDGKEVHRYFMNVAGMALDGRVMEKFPDSLKSVPAGYLIAGLKQLFAYRVPESTITLADKKLQDKFITIHAGLCKFSGGGMQFVPHADPSGDQLAVTLIEKMSIPKLLLKIPKIFLGTLLTHPKVKSFKCASLKVTSEEEIPIEADGEFLGYSPIAMECIPGAFRLIVP